MVFAEVAILATAGPFMTESTVKPTGEVDPARCIGHLLFCDPQAGQTLECLVDNQPKPFL